MLQDTENLEEELEQLTVAITVITQAEASTDDRPKQIGIVIEGVEVITGLHGIARACSVFLGLTCALNLDYTRQLRYTFEVFRKHFLELDASKLSNKVQSLKSKLLWSQCTLLCRLIFTVLHNVQLLQSLIIAHLKVQSS